MAASPIVCPHLHICAQAGDDAILKQMRRNYDTAYYADLLRRVRERLPDAALGSDIIVGFPGETGAQFEAALGFFATSPLTYFHVFPYSSRRGTIAASLSDIIPGAVKKIRSRRMRELGAAKKQEFCLRYVGQTADVLVEEKLENTTGLRRGFSRNYLPVVVNECSMPSNCEVTVRIDGSRGGWLTGRALRDDHVRQAAKARRPTDFEALRLKNEPTLLLLQNELGYCFKDHQLLLRALTHVSYERQRSAGHNEVLEFLAMQSWIWR